MGAVTTLGISAYGHNSAACLLRDGNIVAAAQEECFSRKKHDARVPRNAIQFCLRQHVVLENHLASEYKEI